MFRVVVAGNRAATQPRVWVVLLLELNQRFHELPGGALVMADLVLRHAREARRLLPRAKVKEAIATLSEFPRSPLDHLGDHRPEMGREDLDSELKWKRRADTIEAQREAPELVDDERTAPLVPARIGTVVDAAHRRPAAERDVGEGRRRTTDGDVGERCEQLAQTRNGSSLSGLVADEARERGYAEFGKFEVSDAKTWIVERGEVRIDRNQRRATPPVRPRTLGFNTELYGPGRCRRLHLATNIGRFLDPTIGFRIVNEIALNPRSSARGPHAGRAKERRFFVATLDSGRRSSATSPAKRSRYRALQPRLLDDQVSPLKFTQALTRERIEQQRLDINRVEPKEFSRARERHELTALYEPAGLVERSLEEVRDLVQLERR